MDFKIRRPSNRDTKSLLFNAQGSDLTISCRGRTFPVHKSIICPKSAVIARECNINMREMITGVIEHEEFDDETMERMITFVYTGRYQISGRPKGYGPLATDDDEFAATNNFLSDLASTEEAREKPPLSQDDDGIVESRRKIAYWSAAAELIQHARVYGLADYYVMPELRRYAEDQFEAGCDDMEFSGGLAGFAFVVEEVYQLTVANASPLRRAVKDLAERCAYELADSRAFISALGERSGIQTFAADMFSVLARKKRDERKANQRRISRLQNENHRLGIALKGSVSKQK